ncbi:iron-containing alcohol dehydrogenase [Enterococcus hulanensis]|uniref:Iron-containing alcohol dehydrogenase n=1 Tax=Enterococcus hulanensis TaxID=2559929 RepID=A0ABU3EXJ1_9ENTE|nr:1-propanol dehydrogenase PduQ [Enterococcus hulanensis]MDT2599584.1 iron-containing alcohol dehydrogenase [Enterococcus hulanensis]MDT2609560.1 iron-containing alcohol dehydrogenase [Enterococcus hulanensis]MDT2616137.1 iron-containing alcohol dehydrogenase [Enterococcus hulanensis]MDT2627823.1 iron-containing alcohol dehydrogenase [Enterococcus hulanensis]MDT2654928.1 iron-containing alcohol dehydrogenase [Enterococcus hulanensis]
MGSFKMATKIYSGSKVIACLKDCHYQRVLIICDPFMVISGMEKKVTAILSEAEIPYQLFSEIIPDPTIEVVTKGVAYAASFQPDAIIALGGGSALDTAKAVRQIYQQVDNDTRVQLICIPTTSGTGSEVTSFAVISDPSVNGKYALVDDEMIPDIAILDPDFTLSVPSNVTADTGIDVLTHTLEAYVSTDATDFTDACAEKAMRIIWQDLEKVVVNGENLELREKIHNASCLAGMAFSEASLGICHSLAHALGGRFHIPHGQANAILLPHVIGFNAGIESEKDTPALKKYAEAARLLGVQSMTNRATVNLMIAGIQKMTRKFGVPKLITELDIEEAAFVAAIPEMAEAALKDKCTLTNPRKVTTKDLEDIYGRVCRGGR